MCRCLWISVRRVISVGCAVSTSSIRSAHAASYRASGVTPPAINRGKVSSHDAGCGPACRIALIVAPPPHAMVLLGDVRQRQEVRERARDGQRRLHRQVPQDAGERVDIVSRTRPAHASTAPAPARPCRRAPVPRAAAASRRAARPASAHRPAAARVDPCGRSYLSRGSSVGGRQSQSTVTVDSRSRIVSRNAERRTPISLHLVVRDTP